MNLLPISNFKDIQSLYPSGYGAQSGNGSAATAGKISGGEAGIQPFPGAGDSRADSLGVDQDGGKTECQTCKSRKYVDGSDEMVSFKSPAHVAPQAAGAAVRAHEQEHVTNAYSKAATGNGKVLSASVSIHTSVCPECGRSYVSGGTTHTQIKYYNESNPYQQELKAADHAKYRGMNADYAV